MHQNERSAGNEEPRSIKGLVAVAKYARDPTHSRRVHAMPELSMPPEPSSANRTRGGISLRWRILAGNLITCLLAMAFAVAVAWGGWGDLRKREAAARSLTAFELVMKANSLIPTERSAWF